MSRIAWLFVCRSVLAFGSSLRWSDLLPGCGLAAWLGTFGSIALCLSPLLNGRPCSRGVASAVRSAPDFYSVAGKGRAGTGRGILNFCLATADSALLGFSSSGKSGDGGLSTATLGGLTRRRPPGERCFGALRRELLPCSGWGPGRSATLGQYICDSAPTAGALSVLKWATFCSWVVMDRWLTRSMIDWISLFVPSMKIGMDASSVSIPVGPIHFFFFLLDSGKWIYLLSCRSLNIDY